MVDIHEFIFDMFRLLDSFEGAITPSDLVRDKEQAVGQFKEYELKIIRSDYVHLVGKLRTLRLSFMNLFDELAEYEEVNSDDTIPDVFRSLTGTDHRMMFVREQISKLQSKLEKFEEEACVVTRQKNTTDSEAHKRVQIVPSSRVTDTDERDAMIYGMYKSGAKLEQIRETVNELFTAIDPLGTPTAVQSAMDRYCKRREFKKLRRKS